MSDAVGGFCTFDNRAAVHESLGFHGSNTHRSRNLWFMYVYRFREFYVT